MNLQMDQNVSAGKPESIAGLFFRLTPRIEHDSHMTVELVAQKVSLS